MIERLDYHVAHLEQIEKRLISSGLGGQAAIARLRLAMDHLRVRSGLEHRRVKRVGRVIDEVRRLDGYRRYSLGLSSALADVTR
jgi:hypothetical protein